MTKAEELIKESQTAYEEEDYGKAFELLKQAAELGDDLALENLGIVYKKGDMNIDKNLEIANQWFIKAAAQGSVYSMEQLADNYQNGDGVPQDDIKSLKYFKMAAESGSTYALYTMGNYHLQGKFVEQDYTKALEYFKKAADPDAKFILGTMFRNVQRCTVLVRCMRMVKASIKI